MIDNKTFDTAGRLRSCQLFIRNDHLPSRHFEIVIKEMRSSQGGADAVVVDQLKTNKPQEVHAFLGKYGVPSAEIKLAANEMEKNDHNAASFGFFGSFIYSFDDGIMQ
jgi:hypothetical protein